MNASTAYAQNAAIDMSIDALVNKHATLVKRIAYHLVNRLAGNVDVDDLIQAGMIGLLEAAGNYEPAKGANFETFAGIRIRGAMLDEVRRSDWTPRSVHQKLRQVTEATRNVEARIGHDARDADVAEEMGLSIDEYHKVLRDATCARLFSLEQSQEESGYAQPIGEIAPSPFRAYEPRSVSRRSGPRRVEAARTRGAATVAVLRRRTEPEGNWQSARR